MEYSISQTHQYLLSYGIRPSVQRTAVMNYLLTHTTHPTVDDIYTDLAPSMPTLSKTTVYNTLNLFLEKGAVQTLTIDEHNSRYDADLSNHAHLRCRCCGRVFDIHNMRPEYFTLPQSDKYVIESVEISYVGKCADCR